MKGVPRSSRGASTMKPEKDTQSKVAPEQGGQVSQEKPKDRLLTLSEFILNESLAEEASQRAMKLVKDGKAEVWVKDGLDGEMEAFTIRDKVTGETIYHVNYKYLPEKTDTKLN